MTDFTTHGDFNATELTVKAESDKGKAFFATMFGAGAVSVNVPKSKGEDLLRYLNQKGFSIN